MQRQRTLPFTRDEQAEAIAAALERLRPALSTCKLRGLRGLLDAVLTAPRTERGELPLDALAARLDRTTRSAWSLLKAAEALGLVVVERADGMRRPHCVRLDFDGLRLVARYGTEGGGTIAKPGEAAAEVYREAEAAYDDRSKLEPIAVEAGRDAVASSASPSSLDFAHVRKNFPNVRKVFPNGKPTADNVCLLYLPPYPPKPVLEAETAGGGAGLKTFRGTERAAFGEPNRSGIRQSGTKVEFPKRSETPEIPEKVSKRNESGTKAEFGGAADFENWSEAKAALAAAGLGAVGPAVEQARARGLSPAAVVGACATFAANRAKFKSAGALRFWLANGAWPTDAAVVDPVDRDRRRAAAEADQTRAWETHAAKRATVAAEVDALEQNHGAGLDALGEADRDALAAAVLKAPGLLDAYRRGRWRERGGLVRGCLLSALSERTVSA